MVKARLQGGGHVRGTPRSPQFMHLNSGFSSKDTKSSDSSLTGNLFYVVPFIVISPGGESLNIGSSSCLARYLVLHSSSNEKAGLSWAAFNPSPSSHSLGGKIAKGVPLTFPKSDKELTELLWDFEEVATTWADIDDDHDVLEANDDDQSG